MSWRNLIVWGVVAAVCGTLFALAVVNLGGCASQQPMAAANAATQATITGARIAACVQSVLAEEEQARALARRLAETAAELEAEELRAAVREHTPEVNDELEKVMRKSEGKVHK